MMIQKIDLDDIEAYAKSNGINIIPAIIKVEYELATLDEERASRISRVTWNG